MFHFENDQFYVNDYDLTKLFEEYDNIFTSYEALDFIYGEINELQTFIPTNIESLYQASLNKGLVNNDKKAFMEYLLVVHKIKIAKIRDYMKIPNYKHEQRVKKFEGKWENYKK